MTATAAEPLFGQTVVVIGGSAGIGLATARQARAAGAAVVLTGRNQERLDLAAKDVGALDIATFDATDFVALASFFDGLAHQVDHVMVSGSGPYYAPLAEIDLELARRDFDQHLFVPIEVARHALVKVRPSGSLVLIGGTGGRQPGIGRTTISAMTAAMPALTRNLAVEIAPIRVNLVAPGFVDTSLSASLLGGGLDDRRAQLRQTLPIRRVVGPDDVAALAVHLMTNTALTGATFDVDGGQQLLPG